MVAGTLFHYFCYFLQKEIVLYSAKNHNKSMPIGNEIAHIPYNFPSVTPVDFNHQENEQMVYHKKFFIALVGWSFISHLLVGIGASNLPLS